jgi:shikimate 5-dehydrogenase
MEVSLPITEKDLIPSAVIADVLIHPGAKLVQMATEKGCKVVSGREMWYQQAMRQFQIWLQEKADPHFVYQILNKTISTNATQKR